MPRAGRWARSQVGCCQSSAGTRAGEGGLARLPAHCALPWACAQGCSAPQNLLSDRLLSSPPSRDLNNPSLRGAPGTPGQRRTCCPGLPRPSAAAHSLGHPNARLDAQHEGREGIWKSHPHPSLGQPLPGFLFLPGRGWRVRKGLVRDSRTWEQVESKAMPEARETSGNHVCSRPGRT